MTYANRRQESDRLSKVTREMDKIAFDNPEGFLDDPRFRELDDAYRATVHDLASLI